MLRPTPLAGALVAALALLPALVAGPAVAAEGSVPAVRDVLVLDLTYSPAGSVSHVSYDSVSGPAPSAGTAVVPGGVRIGRPAGTTTGPTVELLPSDAAPLAVGTYSVATSWSPGTPRWNPVLRLVTATTSCSAFSSAGSLVVHDVGHDAVGELTRLAASWTASCSTGARAAGEIRYRSSAPYAAAPSVAHSVGSVAAGSRTPFSVTVRNSGTAPLALGAPESLKPASDAPWIEPAPGGSVCPAEPLGPGDSCTLDLVYVDDGVQYGSPVAQLRLPAPELARGYLPVFARASEVVQPPRAPKAVQAVAAFDGVGLGWQLDSSGPVPTGWKVRRVDGPEPVLLATLPWETTSWADTTLAKGETATYEVAAYNTAGEPAAPPVTGQRLDLPDPPSAAGRSVVVGESASTVAVSDTSAGSTITTTNRTWGLVWVEGPVQVRMPRPAGPGPMTFEAGRPVWVSGPGVGCQSMTGTGDVREAWVRADGTVHRLDADLHLACAGSPQEVQLRIGVDSPFTAVTTVGSPQLSATVGQPPASGQVSLSNRGTTSVDVGAPRTVGADATAFGATVGDCPSVLPPGEACSVALSFAPERAGTHTATVELPLSTPVGVRRLAVSGTSVGPPLAPALVVQPVLGRVELWWGHVSDGGSPLTGISVLRSSGGDWDEVAALPATSFGWTDPDAVPGETYRYRVRVTNAIGSATTPEDGAVAQVATEELLGAVQSSSSAADLASLPLGPGHAVELGTPHDTDLPAVSPDGRTVAYVAYDDKGDAGLHLRSLAPGGTSRVLVDDPAVHESDPAWSPDGTRVCFSRFSATTTAVWCVGTAGGATASAFPGATGVAEPSWLPDGSALVVTDVASSTPRLLRISTSGSRSAVPGASGGSWPAVSPRGDRIAFVVTDSAGQDRLRTLPVAGGTPVDLTITPDVYDRPAWAPDGQAIAVPTWSQYYGWSQVTVWHEARDGSPATAQRHRAAAGYAVHAVSWRRADVSAPVVSFPGAPSLTTADPRIPLSAVDDTVPVGGLTFRCSLDGAAPTACAGAWTGRVAAGTHTLTVTATDPHGRTGSAAHTWKADTTAPAVTAGALAGWTLGAKATFTYAATDATGVRHYDVRYRKSTFGQSGFGAHTVPSGWGGTTAVQQSMAMGPGDELCFSVRARDLAGNLSAWSAERCTGAPLDDRHLTRATGGWASTTQTGAYRGTLSRAASTGQKLTRAVHARRISVVATTCPTCGAVEVFIGSTRIGAVSLTSSTTRAAQVLALPVQSSVRSGTVTLRTTSGKPVHVDGLAVRKT